MEDQQKRTSMERSEILTDNRRQGAAEGRSEAAEKGEAKVRGENKGRGARVFGGTVMGRKYASGLFYGPRLDRLDGFPLIN